MRELLLGCGQSTKKRLVFDNRFDFNNVTRLDINENHKPDVIWDLNIHPLPFNDNSFDEIHAYDVLEHLGMQGDYRFFFREFSEYWRILKNGGVFCATVPSPESQWIWGDPSHTRVVHPNCLVFLSQDAYKNQVGNTQMSDFRYIYKADFEKVFAQIDGEKFNFVLRAKK